MCDHGRKVREGSNEQTLGSEFSVGEGPVKNVRTCVHNQQQRARNKTMRNTHTHTHTRPLIVSSSSLLSEVVVIVKRRNCVSVVASPSPRRIVDVRRRRWSWSCGRRPCRRHSLSCCYPGGTHPTSRPKNKETDTQKHTQDNNTIQRNATRHNTTRHSTTQYNETRHNTTRHLHTRILLALSLPFPVSLSFSGAYANPCYPDRAHPQVPGPDP